MEDSWSIEENDVTVFLKSGSKGIDELSSGVKKMKLSDGDFNIGRAPNARLWFWWWP